MGKKKAYQKPALYWNGGNVILGLICFTAMLALLFLLMVWGNVLFFAYTFSATGTITSCQIEHTSGKFSSGEPSCEATILFITRSGQQIPFTADAGDAQAGGTVAIRYHPYNPQDARIDSLQSDLTIAGFSSGVLFHRHRRFLILAAI